MGDHGTSLEPDGGAGRSATQAWVKEHQLDAEPATLTKARRLMTKPPLHFVCTHNAGRSAFAAALARHQAGEQTVVLSARVDPAEVASACTIASLAEMGIDDSAHVR